ncbi:MAG: hypothetical protein R3C99_08655 [Pirellulaceae bacterium]|nr:hypothetical protein [Planctomycetales bacterium]MCA9164473.1 hypothetical protein [Planctomycetales bacterium]MCA9205519.1 hypothetical protein [Planctomycetales bacterium]MCA9209834.1 hypothetical protein [Planctomycetales bacterium]MCA9223195.1 hypothetical protein [Planctomycetales bacterium]
MGATTSMAICLAAICLTPVDDVAYDRVDMVEVNHFYDEHGRPVFDQVIFYDWCPVQSRYNVRAWRLLKTPAQVPYRSRQQDGFVAVWYDGDTLRKVKANAMRESWTQHDPELVEREYLPKEQRRELCKLNGKCPSSP